MTVGDSSLAGRPLLATKLDVPRRRPGVVQRQRLSNGSSRVEVSELSKCNDVIVTFRLSNSMRLNSLRCCDSVGPTRHPIANRGSSRFVGWRLVLRRRGRRRTWRRESRHCALVAARSHPAASRHEATWSRPRVGSRRCAWAFGRPTRVRGAMSVTSSTHRGGCCCEFGRADLRET